MKILIIGSGAREYSIALSLRNDNRISKIYFCPGNAMSENLGENIDMKDNSEIVAFCMNNIDLVIIGPEAPIINGLGDSLRANNIRVFAPSKNAAKLEGSKIFMKKILEKYKIPTARFIEGSDTSKLCQFIDMVYSDTSNNNKIDSAPRVVIKADGLCGGKGVLIPHSIDEAKSMLVEMLSGASFGEAGKNVVVEEYLDGFELSVFAICDGDNFIVLPSAQDHKRLLDGDVGPNTGGMGAYSPAPQCDNILLENIKNTIIRPTLDAMNNEGAEFVGVLFCGIMVVGGKPFVLEFNVRFGDPECEVILPLLKTPLLDIMNAAIDKKLANFTYEIRDEFCVGVVVASRDYPDSPTKKEKITFSNINIDSNQSSHISFAGVSKEDSNIVASGGRVFVLVGIGKSIKEAKESAYNLSKYISFNGSQMRSDISNKALQQ